LLTWTSLNDTATAYALVGTSPGGPYTMRFTASSPPVTYAASDMCHAPANETGITSYLFPGWFHTVEITGLQPGSVWYAVYGQDGGELAPELSFRTRPTPGPDVVTKFAAFGDSATYPVFPGTVTTVDLVLAVDASEEGPLHFTSVIGDLGYAEGSTVVWALWTAMMWPVASAMPFLVTVGNHETNTGYCSPAASTIAQQSGWPGPAAGVNPYGDDSGGEGAVPTFARYRAPPSSRGQGVLWYSVDVGSVHYALVSSEHDYTAGSAQRLWLEADLASVNRTVTPWLVVALHRPTYNGYNDSDWTIGVAAVAQLEGLFLNASVDLVLAGHYHNYLRTASMARFAVDPTGAAPVYVTVGTGGATYHVEEVRSDARAWTVATDAEWGFGVVEAFNRTALRWTFRTNVNGGAVRDEAWILRPQRAAAGAAAPAVDPFAPEQVHLTLHPDADTLVVTWTSFETVAGVALVQYGDSPSALNTTAVGTAWVYAVDTCPANSTRAMHTATLRAPRGRATWYRVSGNNGSTWSTVLGPTAAPSAAADGSISLSVFGDLGVDTAPAPNAVPALANDTVEGLHVAVVHYGDSCYNCDDQCGAVGDGFLRAVQSYASRTPVAWGPGNHETGPAYGYSEYLNRLASGQAALAAASGSNSTRWYAFTLPGVAFFVIDTDAWIYPEVWQLAQPQWEWLQSALQRIDRTATPWVVVAGHRAMYCTKTDDGECNSEAQTLRYGMLEQFWGLEALLVDAGVDLYLAGHTHHVESTWPVREGVATQHDYINPRATVHVQSGIAGTGPGGDAFQVPQQEWERFRDLTLTPSYTRLTVHNDTHMTVTQLRAADRSVLDTFTIVQTAHGPF